MAELHSSIVSSLDGLMTFIHTTLTSTITNTWSSTGGLDTGADTLDLSAGDCHVQFDWSVASNTIHMSQTTAANGTYDPGATDASFLSEAVFPIAITDAEVFIHLNDTATATDRYCHIVVEFNRDNRFLHFGFGNVGAANKYFTWTGGAYKYGAEFNLSSQGNDPTGTAHRGPLLDTLHTLTNVTDNLATMRASGLRGQNASSKWLAFTRGNPTTVATRNDGDGDPVSCGRGHARQGLDPAMVLFQEASANSALINRCKVKLFFAPADDEMMLLADMPDVAVVNMGDIQPKDELVIGSDTWKFYPWGQKIVSASASTLATKNLGVAYLIS